METLRVVTIDHGEWPQKTQLCQCVDLSIQAPEVQINKSRNILLLRSPSLRTMVLY